MNLRISTYPTSQQNKAIQDAIALHKSGQLNLAEIQYKELLNFLPNHTLLLNNLGIIASQKGNLEDSIKIIGESLAIDPNQAHMLNNLGNILRRLKRFDEALLNYNFALEINPDYEDAYFNRGNLFKDLKKFDEALTNYTQAIELNSEHVDAYFNRGNTFRDLKLFNEALVSYDCAIELRPNNVEAYFNRGNIFSDLEKFDEALINYDHAISLKPEYADLHYSRGNSLQKLRRFEEALASYDLAISFKPDHAQAYFNRGNLLGDLKRFNEALASYDQAIKLKSDIDFILCSCLYMKMYICIWKNFEHLISEITRGIEDDKKSSIPFAMLTFIDSPEVHKKTSEIYAKEKYPPNNILSKISPYLEHKKIRIGYFSSDFKNHPVSFLTAELYETHDREKFEIHAFSFANIKDEMTNRIEAGVDYFHDVKMISDQDIALLSRKLEIDIAVDLVGYTENNRTGIFAMRAAPIQLSYIGYLGTMGASYFDYLIADKTIIPSESQKFYLEKIIYLPSYQVNDSKKNLPTHLVTRQEFGLPEAGFVFCCFNNSYKITPYIFDSWARILKRVDSSVLFIYAENQLAEVNLKKEIVLRGISEHRLIFGKRLSVQEYLARYRSADLFLDTIPYNAGTTASDALRMGLPVLTRTGESFASRMAASLLIALGLPELVTTTQEEYENLAVELATNSKKLKIIKDKLITNLPASKLYNTKLFTKNIETAYAGIYNRYHKGLEPDHIYIEQ